MFNGQELSTFKNILYHKFLRIESGLSVPCPFKKSRLEYMMYV